MFFKDKDKDKDKKWVHPLKMVRALRGDVEWEWVLETVLSGLFN